MLVEDFPGAYGRIQGLCKLDLDLSHFWFSMREPGTVHNIWRPFHNHQLLHSMILDFRMPGFFPSLLKLVLHCSLMLKRKSYPAGLMQHLMCWRKVVAEVLSILIVDPNRILLLHADLDLVLLLLNFPEQQLLNWGPVLLELYLIVLYNI